MSQTLAALKFHYSKTLPATSTGSSVAIIRFLWSTTSPFLYVLFETIVLSNGLKAKLEHRFHPSQGPDWRRTPPLFVVGRIF